MCLQMSFLWILVSWVWVWPTSLSLSPSLFSLHRGLDSVNSLWVLDQRSSRYLRQSKHISLSFSLCRFLLFSWRGSPEALGLSLSSPHGSGRERRSTGKAMLRNWTKLMTKKVGEGQRGFREKMRGSSVKSQKITDGAEKTGCWEFKMVIRFFTNTLPVDMKNFSSKQANKHLPWPVLYSFYVKN